MATPVVHFELGCTDPGPLGDFYEQALGWALAPDPKSRYVTAGLEGGPSGRLNALGHPPDNYVLVYFEVDDLDAALERIAAAGGAKVVGPVPIPDGRRFAWFRDPAGNVLGLLTKPA